MCCGQGVYHEQFLKIKFLSYKFHNIDLAEFTHTGSQDAELSPYKEKPGSQVRRCIIGSHSALVGVAVCLLE